LNKVLLIGGISSNQKDQDTKQEQLAFMEHVLGEQTHCYMAFMDDLRYTLAPGKFQVYDTRNEIDLNEIDVVFIRGMERVPVSAAYYLSRYCTWAGKSCISDYSIYAPANKVAQAVLFVEYGVPFLSTIYSPNSARLTKEAEASFGYPYILKASVASHGNYNYLIRSSQEAHETITANPTIDFLAQEFCPNNYDYRLLILGSGHLLFKRQGDADTHLNNTSKGAQATKSADILPAHIVQQARELAKALGLMLAGVDIIPHRETGELYFLEVNLQPQLRTGAFLDEKKVLLRQLFKDLY
jgi:glutathione synthase/RimK-type ligase-like ATP-grasp enzyme